MKNCGFILVKVGKRPGLRESNMKEIPMKIKLYHGDHRVVFTKCK